MLKLYIFKRRTVWEGQTKTFTHYWTNDGQNFFDNIHQWKDSEGHTIEVPTTNFVSAYDNISKGPVEYYLESYKADGYSWIEIPSTRFKRNSIASLKVELTESEFKETPVLYFKVIADDGTPIYYYSDVVTEVTDQNFENTTYTVNCKIDLWASCWVYMHAFMKDCPVDIEFMRKMANRYIFEDEENWYWGKEGYGFYIDYLKQPHLMRTDEYKSRLVCDNRRENFLTLDDWLFINSDGKKNKLSKTQWLQESWIPWLQNQWCAYYSPNTDTYKLKQNFGIWKYENEADAPDGHSLDVLELVAADLDVENYYKKVNRFATHIRNNDFLDSEYNSKSKYRYLVCKIGNNSWPKTTKDASGKETVLNEKEVMFKNNQFYTYSVAPKSSVKLNGTTDLENWIPNEKHTEFIKDVKLSDENVLSKTKMMFSFEKWIIAQKNIAITIDYKNGQYTSYQYLLDGLDKRLNYVCVNGIQKGKIYEITTIAPKSILYDLEGNATNIGVKLGIVCKEDGVYLRFVGSLDSTLGSDYSDINIRFHSVPTICEGIMFNEVFINESSEGVYDNGIEHKIDGEALILIPFKKGEEEAKFISKLNSTTNGIIMGDGSVLGMVVNDIPPSVLAMALRRYNDSNIYQTFGGMMSSRQGLNVPECPIDLVNVSLSYSERGTGENKKMLSNYEAPCIFAQFDNIPVTVATSPSIDGPYEVIGGNNFFNDFYSFLTDPIATLHNTMQVEPFLYSPAFWKWTYFIDASHKLELTADMIDFKKLITKEWDVYLNTSISDKTSYYLDITEIKNSAYPMSKVGMELITADTSSFPFTTEAYQNWLQNHRWAQDATREMNSIQNKYAQIDADVNSLFDVIGGPITGAGAGLATGGPWGALAGGIIGTFEGVGKAIGTQWGVSNAISRANELWNAEWKGKLGNMYSAPSTISGGGFANGSLVYSPNKEALQQSYELFRTFELPDLIKKYVWFDLCANGYLWLSKCPYGDYNNRVIYNIINANLNDRSFAVYNYLKEKMFEISPIFAQDEYIKLFIEKCKSLIRLFKIDLADVKDYEKDIIDKNIELIREWYIPYYSEATQWTHNIDVESSEKQIEWEAEGKTWKNVYVAEGKEFKKNFGLTPTTIKVPYAEFGFGYETYADIKKAYKGVLLNFTESKMSVSLGQEILEEYVNNKTVNKNMAIVFDSYETGTDVKYFNMIDSGTIGCEMYAEKDTVTKSKDVEVGYKVSMTTDDKNEELAFVLTPYSKFDFDTEIDNTWSFTNSTKAITVDKTNVMPKKEDYEFTNSKPHNHSWYNQAHVSGKSFDETELYTFSQYGYNIGNELKPLGNKTQWGLIKYKIEGNVEDSPYWQFTHSHDFWEGIDIRLDDSVVLVDNISEVMLKSGKINIDLRDEIVFNYWRSAKEPEYTTGKDILYPVTLNDKNVRMNDPVKFSMNDEFNFDVSPELDKNNNKILKTFKVHNEFDGFEIPKEECGKDIKNKIHDGFIDSYITFTVFLHYDVSKKIYQIRYIVQSFVQAKAKAHTTMECETIPWLHHSSPCLPLLIRWVSIKDISNRKCIIKFEPKESQNLKWALDNKVSGITFVRNTKKEG